MRLIAFMGRCSKVVITAILLICVSVPFRAVHLQTSLQTQTRWSQSPSHSLSSVSEQLSSLGTGAIAAAVPDAHVPSISLNSLNPLNHAIIVDLDPVKSTHTIPTMPQQALVVQPHPRRWLHVDDISEGMANWRIAIVELLLVAKQLDAAFVEPCILQGRVTSCHKIPSSVSSTTMNHHVRVRLGDVLDVDKLRRDVHPWIVTQEEYEKATTTPTGTAATIGESPHVQTRFVLCMHEGNPSPVAVCIRDGKRLDNFYGAITNPVMEQVLTMKRQHQQQQRQEEPSWVMEIHAYRKGGFAKTVIREQQHENKGSQRQQKTLLLDPKLVQYVLEHSVIFHPKHYHYVAGLLRKFRIVNNNYNVIHWRAELPHMNYADCAQQLIKAKNIMSHYNNNNSTPTILISSLNQIPVHQWGGGTSTRAGSAMTLRSLIKEHGFLKLDTIVGRSYNQDAAVDVDDDVAVVDDLIYLAIWDQILSQNATKFATCTKACKAKKSCKACNYQGSFGEVAVGLRAKVGRESLTCWPTK